MQAREQQRARKEQQENNVVGGLQTFANVMYKNKSDAIAADAEARKIVAKEMLSNLLAGKMTTQRPSPVDVNPGAMRSPLDLNTSQVNVGSPQPYTMSNEDYINVVRTGSLPKDVTAVPVTTSQLSPDVMPTDEELQYLAEVQLAGGGTPAFGLGSNNPTRYRYQKILAQKVKELGGGESAADVKTRVQANRSAAMQGGKLEASKVGQAVHLVQALDQNYDAKNDRFNVPPSLHAELALGIARLMSPSGTIGIEMMDEIRQKTSREGLANVAIWLGFDPEQVGGTTQDVADFFAKSIIRQGKTAQDVRNQYTGGRGIDFNETLAETNVGRKYNNDTQLNTAKSNSPTPSVQEFETEEDAVKANLKPGTKIKIGGRVAIWE